MPCSIKKTMQTGTQLQRKMITNILTEQPPHTNTAGISWRGFARNVSKGKRQQRRHNWRQKGRDDCKRHSWLLDSLTICWCVNRQSFSLLCQSCSHMLYAVICYNNNVICHMLLCCYMLHDIIITHYLFVPLSKWNVDTICCDLKYFIQQIDGSLCNLPVARGTLSTAVRLNWNTLRELIMALSGSEMLMVPTVAPSGITVGGGVTAKSATSVAAMWLAGMLLLGETVALPLTRMSPIEPYLLHTVMETCCGVCKWMREADVEHRMRETAKGFAIFDNSNCSYSHGFTGGLLWVNKWTADCNWLSGSCLQGN